LSRQQVHNLFNNHFWWKFMQYILLFSTKLQLAKQISQGRVITTGSSQPISVPIAY